MRKHVLVYGLLGGLLIALLNLIEYRYLIIEHSIEIYSGLLALLFISLGLWFGRTLAEKRETVVIREMAVAAPSNLVLNQAKLDQVGLTKRELEILELIAAGLSNKEIAEKSFVSENTVKTHLSRVFDKLGAKRRTQAVQIGKELRLIP